MTQRLALLYARASHRALAAFRAASEMLWHENYDAADAMMERFGQWEGRAERYRKLMPAAVRAAIKPEV